MVAARNEKLNRLQRDLPEGLVVDTTWLDAAGYPKSLRDKYLASGWLEHVSRSLYRRPSPNLRNADGAMEWERVVLSLQNLMKYGVSVGGRTALELQGFAHYLSAQGPREVHLYASEPLPGWLNTVPVNAAWVVHNQGRLFDTAGRGLSSVSVSVKSGRHHSDDPILGSSFTALSWGHWNWPLTLSTPERAVLELLDELPNRESFDQVDALMGSLGTLSPRRLQRLLEACQSVKVKRLFFVFADRHSRRWLKQLDRSRINLGSGKRALTPGGYLHPAYEITVPAFLLPEGKPRAISADDETAVRPYHPVMDRDRAITMLRQLRERLEARGIAHVGVFGSVARNEAVATSDIDVVVTPHHGRKLDLIDFGGVQSLIEAQFDGLDVDIVVEPITRPELRQAVLADRVNAF